MSLPTRATNWGNLRRCSPRVRHRRAQRGRGPVPTITKSRGRRTLRAAVFAEARHSLLGSPNTSVLRCQKTPCLMAVSHFEIQQWLRNVAARRFNGERTCGEEEPENQGFMDCYSTSYSLGRSQCPWRYLYRASRRRPTRRRRSSYEIRKQLRPRRHAKVLVEPCHIIVNCAYP